MNARHYPIWIIAVLLLSVTGCAMHRTADEHARHFFDDGRDFIIKSLKKQEATPEQLDKARAVLDRNEKTVTRDIAKLLRQHRSVFLGVTSGKDTDTLVALEREMHQAHEQAVRSIGKMHDELATTVGDPTWKAATMHMEKKMSRYLRD